MSRLAIAALYLCFTALLSLHAQTPDDRGKSDAARLVGTYTVTSGQRDGKPIQPDRLKDNLVAFTKTRVIGTDKGKKEIFASTYTIDTSKTPWTIEMTSTAPKRGAKSSGVIEVEGDTVRVCYALPGGKAPTKFVAGENQHCFVLKRVRKKK